VASDVDRWEWQALFASEYGPKQAATRHVLHVLVMHLFKESRSVFPSQRRIAQMTGLEVKSVRRHLEAAKKAGWLKRRENKRRGKVGIWYEYFPAIPARHKSKISRSDTMSGRDNSRHDILSDRPDIVSSSTGHPVPHDATPCRPNQVLNQDPNQALNKSERNDLQNRGGNRKSSDEKLDAGTARPVSAIAEDVIRRIRAKTRPAAGIDRDSKPA
jgi:DNA-binding transcriptional MocR family regulator